MKQQWTKENYLQTVASGVEEEFRGDEISRRIGRVYPLSKQIAVLMDREDKPEQFAEYQAFRASVKAEVNAEAKSFVENNQEEQ